MPANSVSSTRRKVLGYPVDLVDETHAIELIERAWSKKRGMHVVTLNAEMVIQAQKDPELDQVVRHAGLIVPDGAGPVWALSLDGHRTPRVPGIELAHRALSAAARAGVSVALLGGRPEVIDTLLEVLPKLHPGLRIEFSHDGYFGLSEEEALVGSIAKKAPGLVLVALGVPKQEYFINRWHHMLTGSVVIGVGGSFDVWAGNVRRAPRFFRDNHLEWAYRLMKEPWRFKRICSALPSFALQVLLARLNGKRQGPGEVSSKKARGARRRTSFQRAQEKRRSRDTSKDQKDQ